MEETSQLMLDQQQYDSKRQRRDSEEQPGRTDKENTKRNEIPPSDSPVMSAAVKKENELSDDCCVRLGVFLPVDHQISREEFMDELDAIHMTSVVECIVLEEADNTQFCWARIYFNSPENADAAATELNIPLRSSKWKQTVTQRLPLKGAHCGEIGTIPAFKPFECHPSDTVVVDTQEGYVAFSTDELYHSNGSVDFMDAKRNGRLIRRLSCKHFDPVKRLSCRYGTNCSFMHIKGCAMKRLLRTVTHRTPLRVTKRGEDDVQVSGWDYERRHDTLVVRNLGDEFKADDLRYMFESCAGFLHCHLSVGREENNRRHKFGVVHFDSKANAMKTLLETYDSNLSITFYGVLEDSRRLELVEAKKNGAVVQTDATLTAGKVNNSEPDSNSLQSEGKTDASVGNKSDSVPFPSLPEGWGYGVSRRTGQYFFFQHGSKAPTSWKHPISKEKYTIS